MDGLTRSPSSTRPTQAATDIESGEQPGLHRPPLASIATAVTSLASCCIRSSRPPAVLTGSPVALNEKVRVPDPDSHRIEVLSNGKPVSESSAPPATLKCRHFAAEFATSSDKSQLLQKFASEEGIRAHFTAKIEQAAQTKAGVANPGTSPDARTSVDIDDDFNRLLREAPAEAKHVVSGEHLGRYVNAVASFLQTLPAPTLALCGRSREANCLLLSHNHVVALHVKADTFGKGFTATVYDPNRTADAKRIAVSDPTEAPDFDLQHMLIEEHGAESYTGVKGQQPSLLAVCVDPDLDLLIDRAGTEPTAQNMKTALRYGMSDDIEAMGDALRAKRQAQEMEPSDVHAVLAARHDAKPFVIDSPGIAHAFEKDDARTIKQFGDLVHDERLGLTPEQKADLLMGKISKPLTVDEGKVEGEVNVVNCLAVAMLSQGTGNAVREYVGVVANSDLPFFPDKQTLLNGRTHESIQGGRAEGTSEPAFNKLMASGAKPEMVATFTQAVLDSPLRSDQKVGVLLSRNRDERSGLDEARRIGHEDTVRSFLDAVNDSSTLPQAYKELIQMPGAKCWNSDVEVDRDVEDRPQDIALRHEQE